MQKTDSEKLKEITELVNKYNNDADLDSCDVIESISDILGTNSITKTITLEITDTTTNEDIIRTVYPDAVFHECDEGNNDEKVRVLHMCSPELIAATFWKEWLKAPYNKRYDCYRTRPDKIWRNNR